MKYIEVVKAVREEQMKKQASVKKLAGLLKKAAPSRADAAYEKLDPDYRKLVDLGPFSDVKTPVGSGLPGVRRQYAPELLKAQLAEPTIKEKFDDLPDQQRRAAVLAEERKIAPGFIRQADRQRTAITQYLNQVLPNRRNVQRWFYKLWR